MIALLIISTVQFNIAANAQIAVQWAVGFAVVVFGMQGILWIISRIIRSLYQ